MKLFHEYLITEWNIHYNSRMQCNCLSCCHWCFSQLCCSLVVYVILICLNRVSVPATTNTF